MKDPPLGPGGEDITWPDPVAPRGQRLSSTRNVTPQTSNLFRIAFWCDLHVVKGRIHDDFVFRLCYLGVHFLALTLEVLLNQKARKNSNKILSVLTNHAIIVDGT